MFEIETILNEESAGYTVLDTILTESNVVRMDKVTLRKKLLTQSILLSAKENKDPLYLKYVKASHIKRELRNKINVKYNSAGKKKMRDFLKAKQALDKK